MVDVPLVTSLDFTVYSSPILYDLSGEKAKRAMYSVSSSRRRWNGSGSAAGLKVV